MRLFLIRHAHAGDRQPGVRDLYRPLSSKGRRRALDLVDLLGETGIAKVLTSPASRCVQTVEPLAEHLGLPVEEQPDLWEGSPTAHVLALLEGQGAPTIAACSHGDIIPEVVDALAGLGASIEGRGCEKGSVWILDRDDGRWTSAVYLDRSRQALPDRLRHGGTARRTTSG